MPSRTVEIEMAEIRREVERAVAPLETSVKELADEMKKLVAFDVKQANQAEQINEMRQSLKDLPIIKTNCDRAKVDIDKNTENIEILAKSVNTLTASTEKTKDRTNSLWNAWTQILVAAIVAGIGVFIGREW